MQRVRVWDVPTRIFHWVNFLAVMILMFVGLVMLFKSELGISSVEAKIGLKTLHVTVGYVFVLNLIWRIVWGFIGNRHARWTAVFPGPGTGRQLRDYLASLRAGRPQQYAGHNPAARLSITVIYLALLVMATTGLIRAGTDIYYPPLGAFMAEYVAAAGVDPAEVRPYDESNVDPQRFTQLKEFKKPFGLVHIYTAYFLMFLVVVHIGSVVVAEIREGNGLVSAMLSGNKVISGTPVDDEQSGG